MIIILIVALVYQAITGALLAFALSGYVDSIVEAAASENLSEIFAAVQEMVMTPLGGLYVAVFALYTLIMAGLEQGFPAHIYRDLKRS